MGDKKRSDKDRDLARIVLITSLINLIQALIDLIDKLLN